MNTLPRYAKDLYAGDDGRLRAVGKTGEVLAKVGVGAVALGMLGSAVGCYVIPDTIPTAALVTSMISMVGGATTAFLGLHLSGGAAGVASINRIKNGQPATQKEAQWVARGEWPMMDDSQALVNLIVRRRGQKSQERASTPSPRANTANL